MTKFLCFVLQIAKFVVLTGPAADEILELHFARLMDFAGPASDGIFVLQICQVRGLDWAWPRMKFGAPFCEAHGLC